MNCGFCGKPFDEDRSQPACRQCPVGTGCGLVRCPHCGYENPGTPGWVAFLKRYVGREGEPRGVRDDAAPTGGRTSEVATPVPATTSGLALPMLDLGS